MSHKTLQTNGNFIDTVAEMKKKKKKKNTWEVEREQHYYIKIFSLNITLYKKIIIL